MLKSSFGHCLNDEDKKKKKKKRNSKKDSAVVVCTCIPHKDVMSLHSCYRHLTGLHFSGMRYVVVLWPDPKTPATDRQ